MISMQDEDFVQSVDHDLWNFEICVHGVGEKHVKEVFSITSLLVWLDQGKSLRSTERDGSKGRELCNQLDGCDFSLLRILDVHIVVKE